MTNEIKTWIHRAGPEYNDSAEKTIHERFMEAEIAELRAKVESLAADAERWNWISHYFASPREDWDDDLIIGCMNDNPAEFTAIVDGILTKEKA